MEIRTQIRLWARRLLLAGTVATTSLGTFAATAGAKGPATAGGPDHLFYIMMENHAYDQIIGNTADAPFINRLYGQSSFSTFVAGGKWRLTGPNNRLGIGVVPFYRWYADKPESGFNQLQRGASPGANIGDFGLIGFVDGPARHLADHVVEHVFAVRVL